MKKHFVYTCSTSISPDQNSYLISYCRTLTFLPRHPGVLSSLSCPSLKHPFDEKSNCIGQQQQHRGGACSMSIFRAAAVPEMTRLRASSRGRREALPAHSASLIPADLDVLAQKHVEAQVCVVFCSFVCLCPRIAGV